MGYAAKYKGVLKFQEGVTVAQLVHLQSSILDQDRRDHPEWNAPDKFYYIDLKVTSDMTGLQWSGAEKSYGMAHQIATVLRLMRAQFPDFDLSGVLDVQGEVFGDIYTLTVTDGAVTRTNIAIEGYVQCPHCNEGFVIDKNKA